MVSGSFFFFLLFSHQPKHPSILYIQCYLSLINTVSTALRKHLFAVLNAKLYIATNTLISKQQNNNNKMPTSVKQYYDSEDDDETLATAIDDLSSLILYPTHSNQDIESFQDQMLDPTNVRISQCQNTYFMDGGVRFISV